MRGALLVAACVLALSAPAEAQPSAADRDTARALMAKGDEKLAAGDARAALDAYEAADRMMQLPTTGLAVGKLRVQLGKLVEARDVLLRVARHPVAPGESSLFAEARSEAERLAEDVAPRIPTLTVLLPTAPVGLAVTIDGQTVDAAALKLGRRVNPGEHEVAAKAPGYFEAREAVTLAAGENKSITLALVADPKAVVPEPEQPPTSDGGSEVHALVWVGVAVTGVGLVLGAVTGGIALSKASSLDDECLERVCSIDEEDRIKSLQTMSHVSTAGFVLAGVGAILGVTGIVLTVTADDDATSAWSIGPGLVSYRGVW
jgi:hypothetical protein